MGPVAPALLVLGPGEAAVGDPTLREQPPALPHAVSQVQVPEPGHVPSGGPHVRGRDPRAGLVEAGVGAAHPDRPEEALEQEAAVLVATSERAPDDPRDDVAGARRVVEDRSRFVGERSTGRVGRGVSDPVAEEHLDDVRRTGVVVVLGEVEPVAHREQVLEGDRRAGITGRPRGHVDRLVEPQVPIGHQHPHHGVEHGLGHRPRDQRGRRPDRCRLVAPGVGGAGVALGDEPAPVDDDRGARQGERPVLVHDLVEQRLEADSPGDRPGGPVLGGPRHVRAWFGVQRPERM